MPRPRRARRPLIALVALLALLVVGYAAQAVQHKDDSHLAPRATSSTTSSTSGSGTRTTSPSTTAKAGTPLSSLPLQARQTYALIKAGGPFPYSQDGVVFRNSEHRLPARASGYYHEYTVKTPGSADRGTRRIITGSNGEVYYTGDHYDSFVRVDVTS